MGQRQGSRGYKAAWLGRLGNGLDLDNVTVGFIDSLTVEIIYYQNIT
jgi:hypothetical protein